jgi:hypothetical protein
VRILRVFTGVPRGEVEDGESPPRTVALERPEPAVGAERQSEAWLPRATKRAGPGVVALPEATAAIQNPTGAITIYRRHN